MKRLKPEVELQYLKDLTGDPVTEKCFLSLSDSFNTLQVRSQLLLGLVTICLTITGFSGLKIAASGTAAMVCIFFGIINVLITAILLVLGPLRIQWMTKYKGDSVDATLIALLKRRDHRTRLYHLATLFIVFGISGYVLSLAFYLVGR